MMVSFPAEAIDGFTIFTAQYIDNLVIDQTLQRTINSGETNAFTFSLHKSVDLLCASKSASALEST
jgi:hypothetical protein